MSSVKIVWDIPTRIIHWSIALCILLNLYVIEEGDPPHQWIGYAAVFFVVVRAIWGFYGGRASRFSAFPVQPNQVLQFIRNLHAGKHTDYDGHNPLASLAYITIWFCIIALGVTGWMMGLDAFWGDEWLEDLHGIISNAVVVLVVFHLVGMTIDAIKFKRKTWLGMILGRRPNF